MVDLEAAVEMGGNGGIVNCIVPYDQTHLLTLLDIHIKGGAGGGGGQGGLGGKLFDHHKPSMGSIDKTYSSDKHFASQLTQQHYPGKPGLKGQTGINGKNGQTYFILIDEDQNEIARYEALYDISLIDYQISDTYGDQIWEFGETLFIQHITIQNTGGMPLPKGGNIYLFFQSNDRLSAKPLALRIPEGLEVGASHTFEEELAVHIHPLPDGCAKEMPIEIQTSLQALTNMNETAYSFPNACQSQNITLQYPAIISPIISQKAIKRGKASRISWKVSNISTQTLGKESPAARRLLNKLILSEDSTKRLFILQAHFII